ncbi:unnamed protein product [Adineta ricciae]|uniref:VPS37 C-terminal domain-containing protein n=1 Tax=Adineta ricciae TaxID=249248 RepID=A0A814RQS3_ADIRI|nr:unnamed protein product [Adineta ricciae]
MNGHYVNYDNLLSELRNIISQKSDDDLQKLYHNPDEINKFVTNLNEMQHTETIKESLKLNINRLAIDNLDKEPVLSDEREKLREVYDELNKAKEEYDLVRQQYEERVGENNPEMTWVLLQTAASELERTTEETAEDFFYGAKSEDEVTDFERRFIENRKRAHELKIKAEKFRELLHTSSDNMPGAKRSAKSVSYTEIDDDDDFVSKKTRSSKEKQEKNETKSSTRAPPRKRSEKLSKVEQEEIDLALKLSKEVEVSIEIPVMVDDTQSTTSQSTETSQDSKITTEKKSDEQDEDFSPKSKRIKREEEEIEDEDVAESEPSSEEEKEEEEEPTPEKKPLRKSKETTKTPEAPPITPLDLNSTRSTTRAQQKPTTLSIDVVKKKCNTPLGFPTSKIVIPTSQPSRVGLSRNSHTIKPLHPNLNQRIVHE